MTAVTAFFTSLVGVVSGLLIPATGTISPLQTLMWAGLILSFIPFVVGLVKSLARGGGGH
jgi:hypothetical protein